MQIRSQKITTDEKHTFSAAYTIDRSGGTKEINEALIVDKISAKNRAIAEFLELGYDKQIVEFTTYFSPIKPNEIIEVYAPSYRVPRELNRAKFIVKNVVHKFKNGQKLTTIMAVRYD